MVHSTHQLTLSETMCPSSLLPASGLTSFSQSWGRETHTSWVSENPCIKRKRSHGLGPRIHRPVISLVEQLDWIWFWHCISCCSPLKHIKPRSWKRTTSRLPAYWYISPPLKVTWGRAPGPWASVCAFSSSPCPALPWPQSITWSDCSGHPSLQPSVTPAFVPSDSGVGNSWCPVSLLPLPLLFSGAQYQVSLPSPLWPQLMPHRRLPHEVGRVQWLHSQTRPQTSPLSSRSPENWSTHALQGQQGPTDHGSAQAPPGFLLELATLASFGAGGWLYEKQCSKIMHCPPT